MTAPQWESHEMRTPKETLIAWRGEVDEKTLGDIKLFLDMPEIERSELIYLMFIMTINRVKHLTDSLNITSSAPAESEKLQ
jgi:hypothetical protein